MTQEKLDKNGKKRCLMCNKVKESSNFYYRKDNGKYRSYCIKCWLEKSRRYREDNWTEQLKKRNEWQQKNPEKRLKYFRTYYSKNKEIIKEKTRIYKREFRTPQARMVDNLRSRMIKGLFSKGIKKCQKTVDLIGCSINELKFNIELQFKDGMSWENYGKWHIDHIKPCAKFNMFDIKQQKECFSYNNLQPLWAEDNLLKSDKYYE